MFRPTSKKLFKLEIVEVPHLWSLYDLRKQTCVDFRFGIKAATWV
jgi:hypothetical protein